MSASEPSSLFTLASIDFGDCNVQWKGKSQTSGEALKIRHIGNIRQAGSCRVTLLHLTPNYVPGCWEDTNTTEGQTRAQQGEPAWSRRRQVQWLPQRQLRCRRRTAGSCASPAHWSTLGSSRWSHIQASSQMCLLANGSILEYLIHQNACIFGTACQEKRFTLCWRLCVVCCRPKKSDSILQPCACERLHVVRLPISCMSF